MKKTFPKVKDRFNKPDQPECKGLVGRLHVNSYYSSHGSIETKKSFRILKRNSCPGCEQCYGLIEFLAEDIAESENDYLDSLMDQKIYKIEIIGGRDFSGDYDAEVHFKRVEE